MYKNIIFSLLAILSISFVSCKSDKEDATKKQSNTEKNAKGDIIQKLNSAAFLTTGYWIIDGYVELHKEPDIKGMYYKFFDDGTFEYYQYKNLLSKGIWKFDWRAQMIELSYEKLPHLPVQWDVMTFNSVMVWKGNTPKNPGGAQVKFSNVAKLPF